MDGCDPFMSRQFERLVVHRVMAGRRFSLWRPKQFRGPGVGNLR